MRRRPRRMSASSRPSVGPKERRKLARKGRSERVEFKESVLSHCGLLPKFETLESANSQATERASYLRSLPEFNPTVHLQVDKRGVQARLELG